MVHIHQLVVIGAPVDVVYKAITTQEGLSAWWTPNAATTAVLNRIAIFPFGNSYVKEMRITELLPFQSVKWTCITGAEEWVGTNLSFQLEAADVETLVGNYPEIAGQTGQLAMHAGTLLRFNHNNWRKDSVMFAECSYTWAQFLKSLKLFCETGTGKPWPNQHR